MVMRLSFYNIPLLAMFLASPAWATEPVIPLDFKGIYQFGLIGLPLGKMGMEMHQDADKYNVAADVTLTGIARIFTRHESHSTVEAAGGDFIYPNRAYESRYQTRKKKRHVKMTYKNGKAAEAILDPPDPKRPQVPAELRNSAVDPLSFMLRMREQVAKMRTKQTDRFTLNVFDGRRLTQTDFTLEDKPRRIVYKGKKVPVVAVSARRKQLAGFTDSEMADADPNEPPLYIYFSRDERLIPLRLEATAWFGKVYAELAKECGAGESCLLGIKE